MKLIFAQGNPDLRYAATRHNIGWQLLSAYAAQRQATFVSKAKFFAQIAETTIADEKILLIKPTTYYNDTGRSVRALVDFYRLDPARDLLVLHDDLALPFGTIRTRPDGSDAGNNGIKSITSHIGQDYWRLRVGIANEHLPLIGAHDFVLGRLNANEQSQLPKLTELVGACFEQFATEQLEAHSQSV